MKAANLGGIALSGLESSQGFIRVFWSKVEMESKLKAIMENVYMICRDTAIDLNQPGIYNINLFSNVIMLIFQVTLTLELTLQLLKKLLN